ncbi:MAG: pilus assembly protein TadG-related protein [Tepidisphaeraceae bacterium]|jgi:Flp pilus assembly protein TadG
MIHFKNRRQTKCRGTAMIWVVVSFGVLCMFCGLAVDLGRAQTTKTELRRAADAAARAGAMEILKGNTDYSTNLSDTSSVLTKVYQVAKANLADGTPVVLNTSVDVFVGNWNPTKASTPVDLRFTPNGSPVNAVEVYARRNGATNQSQVPLIFTQILGRKTLAVWAVSVAQIVTVDSAPFTVSAKSNLWLAGTENLTPGSVTASLADPGYPSSSHPWPNDINGPSGGKNSRTGYPYESPPLVDLTLAPGDFLSVNNVTGTAQNDPNGTKFNANGDQAANGVYDDSASHPGITTSNVDSYEPPGRYTTTGGTEHNITDTYAPINSMLGVFLNNNLPSSSNAPTEVLNFSGNGSSPTSSSNYVPINASSSYSVTPVSQDYSTVSPKLQQSFYVGDGTNGSGSQQYLVVPGSATRLYLGTMDGHEWSNNVGGYSGTVTQKRIELVK